MSTAVAEDYSGERHVYGPHRAGLPPLVPYFRELWRRREFAFELAKTQMRAANTTTFFGQAWLVINPLLLAFVYFLLVTIISGGGKKNPDLFAQMTSGLFLFFYITGIMSTSATAMTAGGKLILNTPFPKMLLTLSSTYLSFRRYLPTLLVYGVIHTVYGRAWGWHLLWMIPIIVLATMIGFGIGNALATLQVYFRDTASFLPYFIRIWLYMSPVLWTIEQLETRAKPGSKSQLLLQFSELNPVFGVMGAQGEVLGEASAPALKALLPAIAWAVGLLVAGSLFMMSREREFAVRL